MNYREIAFEVIDDHIVIIRFNRPEVRNCIGPRTHEELVHAWGRFREEDRFKVAILTGTGDKAFCSGADLRAAAQLLPPAAAEVGAHERGERPGILGPSRWTDIYKPIIGAINGAAYAGGLEWACYADIRVVEAHATFGVTCRRWNIGLADGGTVRLPRIVGMGRALELIITGRVIDAEEALRIGLANEVVPTGASLGRATDLARYISQLPQPAIRTDKESVLRGYNLPLKEALAVEAQCFNRLIGGAEMAEGLRRFIQRDHPDRRPGVPAVTPGLPKEPR